MSNSLMRGFYSGLIAGCVGGLIMTISRIMEAMLGLHVVVPGIMTSEVLLIHLGYAIPSNGIWGGIYGIIYSIFCVRVPGKSVKKGFVFGCMIFFISNIWIASSVFIPWLITGTEQFFTWSYEWFMSFTIWIPYGVVLGVLYERWK